MSRSALPDIFPHRGLHEIYAAAPADSACLSAGALALGRMGMSQTFLWVRQAEQNREAGEPHPAGIVGLGIDPASIIVVLARDPAPALQAALEGARTPHFGVVIVELWGEARPYDLTASRRLALAAKASGALVLVARAAAAPAPSAAETRWRVRTMPSRALAANAPGFPAFEMTLLRARNGQESLRYCMELDRNARQFVPRLLPASGDDVPAATPLSGALVSLSFDRQGMPGQSRQAG